MSRWFSRIVFLTESTPADSAEVQRSLAPGADRLFDTCWGGALTGADRLVIGGWLSHGTPRSSGGRLPPGGRPGCTPTIFVSAWPNRPGWSEYVNVPPLPRTRM